MQSPSSQDLVLIQAWNLALNNEDLKSQATLVREDVKVGGPRGSVAGVKALLEWVERTKVSLIPQRYFKDKQVVVEALGEWHDPDSGKVISSQVAATVFKIKDNLIESIFRYNSLSEAFEASGLTELNEVKV